MSAPDLRDRVTRLETRGEAVMQTLAGLGLESMLSELDEARGAYDE